jgi:hypothetical protein
MSKTLRRQAKLDHACTPTFFVERGAIHEEGSSGQEIMSFTAKGLVYSLGEALGVILGDPGLPEHIRSGYQGLIEMVRKVEARIESVGYDDCLSRLFKRSIASAQSASFSNSSLKKFLCTGLHHAASANNMDSSRGA